MATAADAFAEATPPQPLGQHSEPLALADGWTWTPTKTYVETQTHTQFALEVARATPGRETLIRWSHDPSNQPPLEWWDDDDTDPFSPSGA